MVHNFEWFVPETGINLVWFAPQTGLQSCKRGTAPFLGRHAAVQMRHTINAGKEWRDTPAVAFVPGEKN